jgi:hypothetical protein
VSAETFQAPPLAVVEDGDACYVVCRDDQLDWLVRFEKDGCFPARRWADAMVVTYNSRREPDGRGIVSAAPR